jgi:hypothetical protein
MSIMNNNMNKVGCNKELGPIWLDETFVQF